MVRTGERLGAIGVSGRSSGPHLHWGVKIRNRWLDPVVVLRAMTDARGLKRPFLRPDLRVIGSEYAVRRRRDRDVRFESGHRR